MKFNVIAANTVSQVITKLLAAGTGFIVTLTLARLSGANGYGDFVKATTYISLFFLLTDFGLNAIWMQQDENRAWSALAGLRTVVSIVCICVALAVLAVLPYGGSQGYTMAVRVGILLYSPAVLFQGFITSANAMFQKRLRYDMATLGAAAGSIVTIVTLFACTRLSFIPILLAGVVSILAGSLATALVGFALVKRLAGSASIAWDKSAGPQLFYESIPLGLTLVFNLIYFHADSVILTISRPTSEVGYYGLAYKVFELALVFPTFFMNAIYPYLLGTGVQTREALKATVQTSFFFLLILSLCATTVLFMGAPLVVLIKPEFAASISSLRILSLGLPFFFLSSLGMWVLVAKKKQRTLLFVYALSMILTLVLGILYIPKQGFIAASWITVFGEMFVFFILAFLVKKIV